MTEEWHMGMPDAIDNRRRRYAEWIARMDGRAARRNALRDVPLHDRPHVERLVIEIFEERQAR